MGWKLLESRLCLLVLLGLVLMLASCQRPTPSQWFTIQHIYNSTYPRCNAAMRVINNYTGRCKNLNTFLHTTFANVVSVCGNPNTNCSDMIRTNCHNSSSRVSITVCDLQRNASVYPNCSYQMRRSVKFYTVACDRRTPWDSPIYPVVPVHLDKTF